MNKAVVLTVIMWLAVTLAGAQEFNRIPSSWKWIGETEVLFTYDGTYADSGAFSIDAKKNKKREGVSSPAKFSDFPVKPAGAVNMTYSPDSTKIAFTRDNDLYVVDVASSAETRLTFDGSDVILNMHQLAQLIITPHHTSCRLESIVCHLLRGGKDQVLLFLALADDQRRQHNSSAER